MDSTSAKPSVGGVTCIEIVVGTVVDGGFGNSACPTGIPSADKQNIVQIVTAIGELEFLVGQHFIDIGGQLCCVLYRNTAVVHVGEVVAGARGEVDT